MPDWIGHAMAHRPDAIEVNDPDYPTAIARCGCACGGTITMREQIAGCSNHCKFGVVADQLGVDPDEILRGGDAAKPLAPIFAHVDLTDLASARAEPVRYAVELLIAYGVVTLMGGHGGSGKSMLALIMAAHFALGMPWGPFAFNRGRVLFVSLEDPGTRIRAALARVCKHYWLDPKAVAENFTLIDGTATEAALAVEFADFSGRQLIATAAFAELKALAVGYDLIVVDNASDAFDGNENERRQVRKFVRGMLGGIAREHECAVLLLAHIDKAAARQGSRNNSYSGSTAWHNSARSRLALVEDAGLLALVHEKNNLGKKAEPLPLAWTDNGMLVPGFASNKAEPEDRDTVHADADDVLLAIVAAHTTGKIIPNANSGTSTLTFLKTFPELPAHLHGDGRGGKDGRLRFWAALRHLEATGRIVSENYRNQYRHDRQRWVPASVRQSASVPTDASIDASAQKRVSRAALVRGGTRGTDATDALTQTANTTLSVFDTDDGEALL